MDKFDHSTYDLIEDFINNKLSDEQTAEIKERIAKDQLFAKEVEWMKDFSASMKHKKRVQVLDAFKEVHSANKQTKRQKKLKVIVIFMISLLLMSLIIFFSKRTKTLEDSTFPKDQNPPSINDDQSTKDQELLPIDSTKNTIKDSIPEVPKSPSQSNIIASTAKNIPWEDFITFRKDLQLLGETDNEALSQALILLDKDKKVEALPFLETYLDNLSDDDDDYEIRIETGKVYLRYQQNYIRARDLFNSVIESDAISKYKLEARYYLGLTELAVGKTEKAKTIFIQLSTQEKEPWKNKAIRIIEIMEGN